MWIDSHIHIYDVSWPGVSWPGPEEPVLYGRVMLDDFAAAVAGTSVTRAVVIECTSNVAAGLRTMEICQRDERAIAVTGNIDPRADTFPHTLQKFKAYAKFAGLRFGAALLEESAAVHASLATMLREDVRMADLLLPWDRLPAVFPYIRRHEGLRFVIDHFAIPWLVDNELPDGYWKVMEALSEFPNSHLKLSAMLSVSRNLPENQHIWDPMLDRLLDLFGPERLLYGSDWPVIRLYGNYLDNYSVIASWVRKLGGRERNRITHLNARRIYAKEEGSCGTEG
ncbi:MAG: amidohydrolase family protein [Bacillota bacterium]|nr:amidohydrolase family protein [Bacillota bacterium]